jgi:hypothetical protein
MSGFRTPYPTYDVLAKWWTPSWDEQTRRVIQQRLTGVPPRRFFSELEWNTLEAVAGRLLPQPERAEPIPIAPWIDEKLHYDWGDGFRYADMPPLRAAWQLGLHGIDEESRRRLGASFPQLAAGDQDAVLQAVQHGQVEAEVWRQLPPQRFFATMLLKEVVGAYYAHPAAWSEVGFGGPASPRGYVRLGPNQRDSWEARADPRPSDER